MQRARRVGVVAVQRLRDDQQVVLHGDGKTKFGGMGASTGKPDRRRKVGHDLRVAVRCREHLNHVRHCEAPQHKQIPVEEQRPHGTVPGRARQPPCQAHAALRHVEEENVVVRRRHCRQAVVVGHGNLRAKARGLVHVHGGLAQAEHAPVRVDLVGRQDAALCVAWAAHQHHPVPRHAHGRAALEAVVGVVTARREHVGGSHNVLLVDDADAALRVVGVRIAVDDPGALGRERGAPA